MRLGKPEPCISVPSAAGGQYYSPKRERGNDPWLQCSQKLLGSFPRKRTRDRKGREMSVTCTTHTKSQQLGERDAKTKHLIFFYFHFYFRFIGCTCRIWLIETMARVCWSRLSYPWEKLTQKWKRVYYLGEPPHLKMSKLPVCSCKLKPLPGRPFVLVCAGLSHSVHQKLCNWLTSLSLLNKDVCPPAWSHLRSRDLLTYYREAAETLPIFWNICNIIIDLVELWEFLDWSSRIYCEIYIYIFHIQTNTYICIKDYVCMKSYICIKHTYICLYMYKTYKYICLYI